VPFGSALHSGAAQITPSTGSSRGAHRNHLRVVGDHGCDHARGLKAANLWCCSHGDGCRHFGPLLRCPPFLFPCLFPQPIFTHTNSLAPLTIFSSLHPLAGGAHTPTSLADHRPALPQCLHPRHLTPAQQARRQPNLGARARSRGK